MQNMVIYILGFIALLMVLGLILFAIEIKNAKEIDAKIPFLWDEFD